VSVSSAWAESFTDAWMAARAKVAVLADPRVVGQDVPRIAVDAEGGRVRLSGSVGTEEAKQAAAAAARSVTGVSDVENVLRVVPGTDLAEVQTSDGEIQKMTARDLAVFRRRGLGGRTVAVRVRDGIATLTGNVDDITEWVRASERAREVAGVKAVDNRLWVTNLRLSAR
jgi:hyperosmotically inducible periplasmic protein